VTLPPTQPANHEDSQIDWSERQLTELMSDKSVFETRNVTTYARIGSLAELLRGRRKRVILTSGSFDIIHEGHSMYLEAARSFGDFLIVGVDSDTKIRRRKGPGRPAVPETERLRMVAHQRGVGAVFLKPSDEERWALIRAVRPDELVVTEDTYSQDEVNLLQADYCGHVRVLPRMATISTSARLRLLQLEFLRGATAAISDTLLQRLTADMERAVTDAVAAAVHAAAGVDKPNETP
jgi:rfaE bifunctional protein nucleotidyltransferase chain/domain